MQVEQWLQLRGKCCSGSLARSLLPLTPKLPIRVVDDSAPSQPGPASHPVHPRSVVNKTKILWEINEP